MGRVSSHVHELQYAWGMGYHSQAIVPQKTSDSLLVSRSWDLWFMRVMMVGCFP